jgi:hypothetical protein
VGRTCTVDASGAQQITNSAGVGIHSDLLLQLSKTFKSVLLQAAPRNQSTASLTLRLQ